MITEDYVSFETAKLLKEKGFNEGCRQYWYRCNFVFARSEIRNRELDNYEDEGWAAPTLQMAIKWLREMGWFICIIPLAFYCGEKACAFGYNIWAGDNLEVGEFDTPKFRTYEDACEAAIKYCLEKLI